MGETGELPEPFDVSYASIDAVTAEDGSMVELIETPSCWGGAYWAMAHMSRGELVLSAVQRGGQARYLLRPGTDDSPLRPSDRALSISGVAVTENDVEVTYRGLGGAGVGATSTRARAAGVLHAALEDAGGGREAQGTITLPRRHRVLVGMDDTDSPTEGATWLLAHNIGASLNGETHRYLGHTIVQLYPVAERTQNCTATVLEFGSTRPAGLAGTVADIVERHSLSDNWGTAALEAFDPSALREYSGQCRSGVVSMDDCMNRAREHDIELRGGRGRIGAMAALAWFDRPGESVVL